MPPRESLCEFKGNSALNSPVTQCPRPLSVLLRKCPIQASSHTSPGKKLLGRMMTKVASQVNENKCLTEVQSRKLCSFLIAVTRPSA